MKVNRLFLSLTMILVSVASCYSQDFRDAASIQYNVTNGAAAVQSKDYSKQPYKDVISIPETTSYKGKTYEVVAIEDMAFMNCELITEVIIPNSVTMVGEQVFVNCPKLTSITVGENVQSFGPESFVDSPTNIKKIVCLAVNPPYLESAEGVNVEDCRLYVPAASVDSNKAASGWSEFVNILPIE